MLHMLEGIRLDREGRMLAVPRLGSSGGAYVMGMESPAAGWFLCADAKESATREALIGSRAWVNAPPTSR